MTVRSSAAVVVTLLAGITAAACSGPEDEPGAGPEPSAPGAGPSSDAPAPAVLAPADLPPTPRMQRAHRAVDDLVVKRCGPRGDKHLARGHVRNRSSGKVRDYVVTVSWQTDAGGVVAREIRTLEDVGRDRRRSWRATTDLPAGSYSCSVTAARGDLDPGDLDPG